MTSLPIQLPQWFIALVNVGDTVKKGQVIAQLKEKSPQAKSTTSEVHQEVSISLAESFGENPHKVGKYLLKSPGESISVGEVIAVKKSGITLKKIRLVSQINGIILRFERGSGQLIVRLPNSKMVTHEEETITQKELLSPLDGKITVCDNQKIVLEAEGDALLGTKGSGAEVSGEIDSRFFEKRSVDEPVTGSLIKRDLVDKILLVHAIEREALVKADAIGVKGVITTSITGEDIAYLQAKHPGLPVVEVDEAIAKQVQKTKATHIILNGLEKTILETA